MAKKFIDPNWKLLRLLDNELQTLFFYCWDKTDAVGVYEYDPVYIMADIKIKASFDDLLKLPGSKKIGFDKIIFTDYIIINYGALKSGYNPHKPAFRAIEKHNLKLNSSLNQAWLSLEEEDTKEDEEEGVGDARGKFNTYPEPSDVGDLPELKINAAIEYLTITKGLKNLTKKTVIGLWNVFKVRELTGKKPYKDIGDVYTHFFHGLKFEKIKQEEIKNTSPPVKSIEEINAKYDQYQK